MLENEFENKYWPKLIMGIDEAGRGPLCGPLVVGACILRPFYQNDDINDSKKLSDKKRKYLFNEIINNALYYNFKIVSPQEIDRLNIYQATKKAMEELAEGYEADVILTDAMPLNITKECHSIIKGDAKSISIAAGSILAKVLRDKIMDGYNVLHPEYEFNKHKGYPTSKHLKIIKERGLLDFYRITYGPCIRLKK